MIPASRRDRLAVLGTFLALVGAGLLLHDVWQGVRTLTSLDYEVSW